MSRAVLAVVRNAAELAALAGGTLLRLADAGDTVFLTEVPSSPTAPADRDRIGLAFAELLGATWLGNISLDSTEDARATRDPVMDVIRRARPDLILVSPPMREERLPLNELVFNAAYCSTIPNYVSPTGLDAAAVRAPIVEIDSPSRSDYQPDLYVEISEHWQRKLELVDTVGAGPNEIRDLTEVTSRARGVQVQVEFAEAFRFEKAWGRLRPFRHFP